MLKGIRLGVVVNEQSELERQVPYVTLSIFVTSDRSQSSLTLSVTIIQVSHPPNVSWYLEGGCGEKQSVHR